MTVFNCVSVVTVFNCVCVVIVFICDCVVSVEWLRLGNLIVKCSDSV